MKDARGLELTADDPAAVAAADDFAARVLRLDQGVEAIVDADSIGGSDAQDDLFRQTYLRSPRVGTLRPPRISTASRARNLAHRSIACWRIDTPAENAGTASLHACGCGSRPPGSGRGRGLPAGGTAEPRGVVGSMTDSRDGRLPASRSLISSPVSVSNSSNGLAKGSRSPRFSSRLCFASA